MTVLIFIIIDINYIDINMDYHSPHHSIHILDWLLLYELLLCFLFSSEIT